MSACHNLKLETWNLKPGLFVIALALFAASGATCQQYTRQFTQPRTLPPSATLDQVMTVVNDNTARVQSLQSTQASLSVPGAPSLRANVALQMPQRLRMRADAPLGGGPELDLGANEDVFWLWVRRNQPPALFFCRRDQFAVSSARQIIPVEPEWLIEAIGLTRFDPLESYEGPKPVGSGRVEIRSHKLSSLGDMTKITILDAWDGTVLEQHLYDAQGQRIATSITSKYKRDPNSGAALPRSIDVQWPTAQMSFHLDVNDWQVNAIPAENLLLWAKPDYPGYPNVDLADPNLRFTVPAGAAPTASAAAPANLSGPTVVYPGAAQYPAATMPQR